MAKIIALRPLSTLTPGTASAERCTWHDPGKCPNPPSVAIEWHVRDGRTDQMWSVCGPWARAHWDRLAEQMR